MEKDSLTTLAKFFKDRDNPDTFGPCLAKVINMNPLKLKMQEKIFLGGEYNNLIVSDTIDKKIKSASTDIKINDSILVVPSQGSIWYAVDKVVL